jgi:hypothetical protein
LKRAIDHSADTLDGDIDAVKTQLGHTDNTVNTIQTQVTDIQASMARLEATVTCLTGLHAQGSQPYADADSIGDNEEVVNEANEGQGRGVANRGHGFHPLGIPRPAKGRHRRRMFLADPSSEFRNFLAKMPRSTSIGRCVLSPYGVYMSARMKEKIVYPYQNLSTPEAR